MKQWIMLAVLLSVTTTGWALGLGEIQIESRLNQRFDARIPVIIKNEIDASDITVKLADKIHYDRAGLRKTAVVTNLMFKPERLSENQMVIKVTSKGTVREPMVAFILEVEHEGNRALREYTAFLESPHR